MALNCSTKVLNEVLEREGENVAKSDIKYYDSIISSAILNQIDVLEKMQERAMDHNDSKAVCALSECIIAAAESYDRHINSER